MTDPNLPLDHQHIDDDEPEEIKEPEEMDDNSDEESGENLIDIENNK